MWYAQRGRGNKQRRELRERGTVSLNDEQERQIKRMLREVEGLRENTPQSNAQPQPKMMRPADVVCQNFYGHGLMQDPKLDQQLQEDMIKKEKSEQYRKMQTFRQKLPSFKMKDELLSLIRSNQVVVISGETGCGKTTQVPQFILDDYINRGQGSTCRVICTQPRRISAITVAERVAAERAERCGRDNSVGYQIRLENAFPRPQGCILYCTTGILLKWLEGDKYLKSVSHIVLDEVHERDLLCDFLLIILKELLPKRSDLKLILMSATLRAELFSDYFNKAPMINIPGFTFGVTEYYLEDILEMTRYQPPRPKTTRNEPVWVKYKKGKKNREEEMEKEEKDRKKFNEYLESMRGTYSEQVVDCLSNMNHDVIDLDLTAELLRYISLQKPDGAILVFLPGWDQISKLHDKLTSQTLFSSDRFVIIPLHSMMPTLNQKQVFERPPQGVRKIIIATNIAETSITIDDVVYVVNIGRVKETNFDFTNNIRTMKAEWVSKASAHQRRGRAGRVQDGICYHVYTQLKASEMEEYQVPEIKRTPLEELCLNIKTLKLGGVHPFISKAMEAPDIRAIQLAIQSLKQMRAFDDN
nr:ATP-dependent DNA/RNA helicase DHX36-like [Lytechinus pictus]